MRLILSTLGIEKEVNVDIAQSSTDCAARKSRKRIKIDSIDDVIKSFNGSMGTSSDDDEPEDEVAEYIKAKISFPKGESLLRWWYNHSLVYKK